MRVAGSALPPGAAKSILIVDDSASVRKLIELTLRREGHTMTTADSGVAALAALAEQEPDLVLLDLMLVSLDGFQICKVIRRHPRLSGVPIVMLTGREGDADRQAGYAAGVDAYLTKPFRPEDLLRTVRQFLNVPAGVRP